jgi:DNA-binding transcriptional ArsR family regulator
MPRTARQLKKPRSREEAASFAVGHRLRIEILAVLHEGPATIKVLAKELRQTPGTVGYHVEELLLDGSIEVAKTEEVGSVTQYWYCMTKLPEYTSAQISELTPAEQQATYSLILQSAMAEALAALWNGQLLDDPRLALAWNRIELDAQGRVDLADEQDRSWERMHEIEAESINRKCAGGGDTTSYVVATMGFKRSRTSAPALGHAGNPRR